MKIVAIDPGTFRTGYAAFSVNGRSPELLECGKVFVRGKDLPERLLHIHRDDCGTAAKDSCHDGAHAHAACPEDTQR